MDDNQKGKIRAEVDEDGREITFYSDVGTTSFWDKIYHKHTNIYYNLLIFIIYIRIQSVIYVNLFLAQFTFSFHFIQWPSV